MDGKRATIVTGVSVAALVAGWFIRRWYIERKAETDAESVRLVKEFDKKANAEPAKKRRMASTNGRKAATTR